MQAAGAQGLGAVDQEAMQAVLREQEDSMSSVLAAQRYEAARSLLLHKWRAAAMYTCTHVQARQAPLGAGRRSTLAWLRPKGVICLACSRPPGAC